MDDLSGHSTLLVPSVLYNLQHVLEEVGGPYAAALLGTHWGFVPFDASAPALAEFDLPIPWRTYTASLARLSGIRVEYLDADEADAAFDRVEFGQPVIIAVDSHDLPYRPAYGRVHSARTIVVTGVRRDAGTAEIVDCWMPAFTGSIRIDNLRRARASLVPHDMEREPLYAGTPLRRRWWTLALLADPEVRDRDGTMRALASLVAQADAAEPMTSADAMDEFRISAVAMLSEPLATSQMRRRAAALHLRGEIGLRAYLHAFLRRAVLMLDDPLLGAELAAWSRHLALLEWARDLLIKSVVFEGAGYAALVDRAFVQATRCERRFARFLRDLCREEAGLTHNIESASC